MHTQIFGHATEFRHIANGILGHQSALDTRIPLAVPAMARYAQERVKETPSLAIFSI